MSPVVLKRRPLALSLARFTSFAALTTALSIASGSTARAASFTWDGEAGSAWSNALNWSSDTLPTAVLPGDDLIFAGPTAPRPTTIDLGADRIANSLSFTADGFSLGNVGTGNGLTISSGNVSVAGGLRATLNTPLLGAGGLSKAGNGTLVLQNLSAYTGTVAIGGGSIVAVNNGAFGASANSITLDGGTLRFYNQTNSANPPNNFGSGHGRVSRFINIGASGGTINVPSQNIIAFDNVNAFTGTGTLTKTGIGEFQIVNANNFAGNLVVAASGGSMWVRASGKLTNAASITVNTGGTFVIDNQNGVGLFASVNDNDRLADSIPVTLLGGSLSFTARNSTTAGQSAETVGKVTLGQGQSFISSNRSGGNGADFTIGNLVRESGNIVRFTGTNLGTTGDNSRTFISQLNNSAAPTGAPTGTNPAGFLGGWALYNSGDFANNTGGTNGLQSAAYTTLTSGNFGATTLGQVTGADVTIGAVGSPISAEILSLKLADGATRQLLFSDAADTLYVVQGGVLSSDNNNAKSIGSTTTRGRITAGSATGTGLRELFLLQNQNTMTVNSVIIDNPNGGAGVSVTKGLDGTVVLTAANAYTGGTNVFRGALQVNAAGGLGSGPVVVKGNARLQLQAAGTVTAAAGIEVKDQADVFLNGGGISWTQPGDIFTIRSGSTLIANQNSTSGVPIANQGMNSLNRVAGAPVNGGEVLLEPGAIVAHNTAFNGVNGSESNNSTIKNLGTNADLFFGITATFNAGANQTVTLGAGTPWMGLSTDSRASRAWQQGTITLNSDVTFQGGLVSGSITTLTLGGNAVAGSYSLANASSGPVRIFTANNVILDEDTPVSIAPNISFVVQSQSTLFPNRTNSFGSGANTASSVVVQAAGTLDPGSPFATIQPAGTAGPLNAPVVIESGGRLLLNDGNGVGSGALITVQREGIVEVANTSNALAGIAETGQFAFQSGAIFRLNQDNIYLLSSALGAQSVATLQVYGGNRAIASQSNPFLTVGVGTPVIAPEVVSLGAGGGITNDSSSRQLNVGRGNLRLFGATDISATTGTTFSIQANLDLQPGATVSLGLQELNGNPKRGDVRFVAPNSNTGDATTTISITGGTRLLLGNVNTIPDASTVNIAPGGQLLLDVANQVEVVGRLTGTGEVRASQTGTQLVIKTATDQTLGATFSSLGTQQPTLTKWGTGNLTIDTAQTSTGDLRIEEGTLTLSGAAGQTAFGIIRPARGAELVLNNSVVALENRLGGKNINGQGGTVRLIGGSTPLTETIAQLNNGSTVGDLSFLNIQSGSAPTNLLITTIERFDNAGGRQSTWVLRGSGMAGLPGTYGADTAYTPNSANPTSGLFRATNPNFFSNVGLGQQTGTMQGYIGTPLVPVRGDLLGDLNPNGTGTGFVTQESSTTGFRLLAASEYQDFFHFGTGGNNAVNVKLAAPVTGIGGDTRIATLTMANNASVTLGSTLPLNQTPSRLIINAGGILVQPGANASINAPYLQVLGGVALSMHTQGNLAVNATIFSDTSVVKTGAGTLTFAPGTAGIWRGTMTIDEGTVNLGANNSFFVTRNQNGFIGQSVHLNGGTLNLNGNSQMINALNSSNILPGFGGVLSSASVASLIIQGGGAFSGSIQGAISLDKVANNTLLLTSANSYTGSTKVRGGTLQLRDSGTLTATSNMELVNSAVQLDNGYLSNIQNRLPSGINIVSKGGTFTLNGAAAQVARQVLGTLTLDLGLTTINNNAGGNGANEINYANIVRPANSGTMINFGQNLGFLGTAGDTTTGIRNVISGINGQPVTLTNGIIGGWAIGNGDHFATYSATTGVGLLSNTADGFATYGGTDLSTATAASSALNYNDATSRTIAAGAVVNAIRHAPTATQTLTLSGGLTIASGGLLTNAGVGITYNGGTLTSGSDALYAWINQNTTTINSAITGAIDLVKGGGGALTLGGVNTYLGETFVDAGTLNVGVTAADGSATVAVPGDLMINGGAVATVTVPRSIKETANVTITGSGRLNMRDAAATVESLGSIMFRDGGGATGTMNVDRAASRPDSTLNLTAATAITAANTNPSTGVPYFGVNLGKLGFTGSGPQTIDVTSPLADHGLAAIGLRIDAQIDQIPTGGLIKTGNGLLALNPTNAGAVNFTGVTTGYDGNVSTLKNVMDVQQGILRFDNTNAGGTNTANFTIQSGAGLLYRNITANGSARLNAGSFLGAVEGNATIGTATTTVANQTVLNVAGNSSVYVADYFVQGTNAVTVAVLGRLTGSGNIDLVAPQITSAGGVFRLGNPILTGVGSNDYTGTIRVNTNTILENQVALLAPAVRQTGNALGAANIELNGGRLRLRDDLSDSIDAASQTITYGNNVTLLADSFIDANRQNTSAAIIGNTIVLGTLTVPSGTKTLTVDSGNTYGVTFTQLAGSGVLMKGGASTLTITDYAPNFAGGVGVQGSQGIGAQFGQNLVLVPDINNMGTFVANGGYSLPSGKTLNISGILKVGNNAGTIANGFKGVASGENKGAFHAQSGTVVTAGVLENDGLVGSFNNEQTISAPIIRGGGTFTTVGQPLTLDGNLVNGTSASRLKFTGDSTVNLTGAAHTASLIEVQSGIVRIVPTAGIATIQGNINVMAVPASTVATGANAAQAVAGIAGTLQFDAPTVAYTGNITNSGMVQVSSGIAVVTGTIAGTPMTYVPGLLEGRIPGSNSLSTANTRPGNPGTFGIKLEPRMAQTNLRTDNPITGWSVNEMWVYTGEFYDADGKFTFAEAIDDLSLVSIDGVNRIANTAAGTNQPASTGPWNTITTTASTAGQQATTNLVAAANAGTPTLDFGMGPNNDGWHTFEVRVVNTAGSGGAGFFANFGLGLNADGTTAFDGPVYSRPIDPGDGSLFRTKVGGAGKIQVDAGGRLNVGGFNTIAEVNLGVTAGLSPTLHVTASDSSANALVVSGVGSNANLNVAAGRSLTVGTLTVPDGSALTLNADDSGLLAVTGGHTIGAGAKVFVEKGTLRLSGNGGLAGSEVQVFQDATLDLRGSLTGNVSVNPGGVLTGNGTVNGFVSIASGAVAPGASLGILTVDSLIADAGAHFDFQIGGGTVAGTDYDQLKVTGIDFELGQAQLNLIANGILTPNAILAIVMNVGSDVDFGTFSGLASGEFISLPGGQQVRISYYDNPGTPTFETTGVNQTNVSLLVTIPEPGSAALLLGGLASVMGLRRRRRA